MEERKYIVYLHVSPSCKYYVGITKNGIKERSGCNGQRYRKNIYFTRAIQKYGWDNFEHKILAKNLTCKEACKLEEFFIQKYNSANLQYGYNLTYGGEGNVPTEHSRYLISKNHADCSKENNSFWGKHHTEKTKKLISENHDYSKQSGSKHFYAKKVICFETLQIFGAASVISQYFELRCKDHINSACRNFRCVHNLHVMYYEDFIKYYNQDQSKLINYLHKNTENYCKDGYHLPLPFGNNLLEYYIYFKNIITKNEVILQYNKETIEKGIIVIPKKGERIV